MEDGDNIMTLEEMAEYLKIARKRLLKMARAGDIPATKIASQWRFMRTVVDDWLIGRMKSLPQPELERLARADRLTIPLRSLMRPELVRTGITGNTKEKVLRQLCRPLVDAGLIEEDGPLLEKLLEREEMVSTAIFPGIAIPHPRRPDECPVAEPRIVLGISSAGVDFDSLDGQPTYALFLICANRVQVHLKVLAELTMLFRQSGLVAGLREARSGAEALDLLFRRTEGGAPGPRD
jgi:PTS system fructose-specific IIC component